MSVPVQRAFVGARVEQFRPSVAQMRDTWEASATLTRLDVAVKYPRIKSTLAVTTGLVLLCCGLMNASPASAATLSATVTLSGTDVSGGYPLTGCNWDTYGTPLMANQYVFTPSASGSQTFSLTSVTWSSTSIISVFDTTYAEANCLGSDQPQFPILASLTLNLTAGHEYVVSVWGCSGCTSTDDTLGSFTLVYPSGTLVNLGTLSSSSPDLTPWVQAYQRPSKDASCRSGWNPSWQQWPGNGVGGWVCTREVLAYAPLSGES